MAQSSNRFGLDEVNTQLTAPTSNVQVQGPLNTNLTTSTRSKGFTDFSNAVAGLARKKLANKIHNDTVDALLDAADGKERNKKWEPEAEYAFNYAIDLQEFDKLKNNLANFSIVEGTNILNDSTLSRKEKLSNYQTGMQNNINTALQAFTPSNYSKFSPLIDKEYSRYSLIASTDLAKQKKEEDSSTNAAAITANVNIAYDATARNIADQLADRKDGVGKGNDFSGTGYDDDLSPKEFAKLTIDATNLVSSKGLSVTAFNTIVNQTQSTGVGADNRETKATVFAAMIVRLLKAAEEGDFVVDRKIVSNLMNKVKGNPQSPNSTIRTEITGNTPYGTIFKTIEDGFDSNLKTILTNKRTLKNQAIVDADNKIGNILFDNVEKFTQKQGQEMLKGMGNINLQLTSTKRWNALFTDAALNGSTSAAYVTALIGAHKAVLKPNGKEIDEIAFSTYVYEHKLKPEAATKLRTAVDPESKAAKHRTAVLQNKSIDLLLTSFTSTTKAYLKNLNIAEITRIANGLQAGEALPNNLILSKLKTKLGANSPVFNKASQILNAELEFTEQLESLILNNPDKEPTELVKEAKQMFNDLFADVVTDKKVGTTATDRDLETLNTVLEKRKLMEAGSGAVTLTTAGSGKGTLKEAAIQTKTALSVALNESDNPEATKKYIEIASQEVAAAQKAISNEANFKVLTRGEKLKIVMAKGGRPTASESAKRTVDAFETNPDAFIVLRSRALQDKATEENVDKKIKAQMEKNREAGKEIFSIGNFQLTTDEAKKAYGNVKHYLKGFYDIISDADTPEAKAERQKVQAQSDKTTAALENTTKEINKKDISIPRDVSSDTSGDAEPFPVIKEETKESNKVSSVEPELSTAQKIASAINTVVGSGTAKAFGKPFEELPEEIKVLPKKFQYITDEDAVKSIKRNNPFNVEKGENWQGLVKSDSNRFFATDTPLNGLRAGYINILAKLKRGKTLGETIQILSPKSDNNPTSAMIKLAENMSEVGKNDKLEVSMDNFEKIKQLGLGLLKFEAPNHNYPDSLIDEAVKLAIEQKTNVGLKSTVKGKEFYPPSKSDFKVKKIKPIVEKGSILKSLFEMPRKVFNEVVPDNLRFFTSYLKDNKILSPNTKKPVVTEKALSSGVQSVLMKAVKKAISSGKTNVDYSDYPDTSFGMSVPAIVAAKGRSKEEYKEAKDRYPQGWLGKARLLLDSSDDVVSAATTIGGFNFKIINGDVVITDIYDFSKYGGKEDSAYAEVRKDVHTKKGNIVYQVRANLGKLT